MAENVTSSPLTWRADSQDPSRASLVRAALREVYDPELGMNVIELGLVREVEFQSDSTHLRMILTTPFCPYATTLLEMARAKVAAVTGGPVTIELGTEIWDRSLLEDGAGDDWGLY